MEYSPFTPGAGHTPPVLAGRDELLRDWQLALSGVSTIGRVRAKDMILTGPPGVGKTAVMTAFGHYAKSCGYEVVNLEATLGHGGLVQGLLQRAQMRLAEESGAWKRAWQAFERFGGLNVSVLGTGAGVTINRPADQTRLLDPGSLAQALATLAKEVRRDRPQGGLVITVDELQAAAAPDLALLAAALHRLNVDHPDAAVAFAGTGLGFTPDVLRKAGVTHPDRLFTHEPIPLTLDTSDALYAIVEPAARSGVSWEPSAAERIVKATNGYPAHLQLFADTAWMLASGPERITDTEAETAVKAAESEVKRRTLDPRWDRLTDRQMEFLAALAVNGGSAPVAILAAALGRSVQDLSWLRQNLLHEGDIYAPKRGRLALTVPSFADYILNHYDEARALTQAKLLGLDEMRRGSQAGTAVDLN